MFATSPIQHSIFKNKGVNLPLVCCWAEDRKAPVSFLPCFISAIPKCVTSREASPGGLRQSFRCGYVLKDNHPEHRTICKENNSSHSSLAETLPWCIRHVNHLSA